MITKKWRGNGLPRDGFGKRLVTECHVVAVALLGSYSVQFGD